MATSQENKVKKQYNIYIEPEFMQGAVVDNYGGLPKRNLQNTFFLNIGTETSSKHVFWPQYYNYPDIGLSFFYSDFGNDTTLGHQFGTMPFVSFKLGKGFFNTVQIKLGLGAAYFNKYYNIETNRFNKAIGSHYTWSFLASISKQFNVSKNFYTKIGGSYLHNSNGHIQLPNYGLNSAMFSLAIGYNLNPDSKLTDLKKDKTKGDRLKFIQYRQGVGMHELGSAKGPAGGKKKEVYSSAFTSGIIFNNHLKVLTGFTYRFYQHYYDYILDTELPDYQDSPALNSSNIFFFLGSEFLMGHVGLDIEGGLNLYKPFYKTFYQEFEAGKHVFFVLKKLFNTRLGLNYYLINTDSQPKTNIFIGAHINANFGQADFSEISLGITKLLD